MILPIQFSLIQDVQAILDFGALEFCDFFLIFINNAPKYFPETWIGFSTGNFLFYLFL